MTLPLTDEMRAAIRQQADGPICLEDAQTRDTFVLVELDEYRRLVDERLRRDLQVGFSQADRGEVAPWNVDEFLAKAHSLHQSPSRSN
jgi:hypothetical protein